MNAVGTNEDTPVLQKVFTVRGLQMQRDTIACVFKPDR